MVRQVVGLIPPSGLIELFQQVLHKWCNKDRGMCCHICGFSKCSINGVTKIVVCVVISVVSASAQQMV